MPNVNLDALIRREDFEATGTYDSIAAMKPNISITDLTSGFFYPFLRKPDFQRETSEWDMRQIVGFLQSFTDGDLIPSIILWRSKEGLFFVIDGAHRLSALIAWANNDYGDGEISEKFYEGNIPEDQKKIGVETRKIINREIGSYQAIVESSKKPDSEQRLRTKASNIGVFGLTTQWVTGEASKAEDSFFKINAQGEPLNPTEKKLLRSRKKGNCVASRAIIRGGKGHKFWSGFSAENQIKVQEIAQEINNILFTPALHTPIKSLELPIAGKISAAQSLPLIFDFVNLVNQIPADFATTEADDVAGEKTVRYLQKARKIAWRINSIHPSSLGLHPAVYFYSIEGRHKPASFYAVTSWILEGEEGNVFREFIKVRSVFEDLLVAYDFLIQDIVRKFRQAIDSSTHIKNFYVRCLEFLAKGFNIDETVRQVIALKDFNYLKIDSISNALIKKGDFTPERKSAAYMGPALESALRCKICNARLPGRATTIDHIVRKADGGTGEIDNAQLAHPYCNSTVKN